MLLLRAREAVMRHFRASLRVHGVTEQQWRVLRALGGVDEIEVTELARRTYLLGPSLSRILPDLEARKLIARRNNAADLRKTMIALSPKGRATIEAVAPHSEAVYARIARQFGAGNLARLGELLVALEKTMAEDGEVWPIAGDDAATPSPRPRRRIKRP
jgi:homoprotocatechuate degradation regulator HpaR